MTGKGTFSAAWADQEETDCRQSRSGPPCRPGQTEQRTVLNRAASARRHVLGSLVERGGAEDWLAAECGAKTVEHQSHEGQKDQHRAPGVPLRKVWRYGSK